MRCHGLPWADVEAWQPEQGLLWIHLDADHEAVLKWLTEKSGLSPLVTEALLEVETRPCRVVSDADALVILRGVNCNPGADLEDMVSMRMFIRSCG
jgi:zinc transporter